MKTPPLRNIALWVREPETQRFYWVLLERTPEGRGWSQLSESEESYREWLDALNAGTDALMSMVTDGRLGPRVLEVGAPAPVSTRPQ